MSRPRQRAKGNAAPGHLRISRPPRRGRPTERTRGTNRGTNRHTQPAHLVGDHCRCKLPQPLHSALPRSGGLCTGSMPSPGPAHRPHRLRATGNPPGITALGTGRLPHCLEKSGPPTNWHDTCSFHNATVPPGISRQPPHRNTSFEVGPPTFVPAAGCQAPDPCGHDRMLLSGSEAPLLFGSAPGAPRGADAGGPVRP